MPLTSTDAHNLDLSAQPLGDSSQARSGTVSRRRARLTCLSDSHARARRQYTLPVLIVEGARLVDITSPTTHQYHRVLEPDPSPVSFPALRTPLEPSKPTCRPRTSRDPGRASKCRTMIPPCEEVGATSELKMEKRRDSPQMSSNASSQCDPERAPEVPMCPLYLAETQTLTGTQSTPSVDGAQDGLRHAWIESKKTSMSSMRLSLIDHPSLSIAAHRDGSEFSLQSGEEFEVHREQSLVQHEIRGSRS